MKKFLFSLFLVGSIVAISQTTIQLTDYYAATTIAANSTLNLSTTPNNNTNITIDIKNTGGSTKTYKVKRYDVLLNAGGNAFFCVGGTCYGSSTFTGQVTLNSNQSASQSTVTYNMLVADMDEGATVGISVIKYSFINTSQANDSVQITLKYNAPVGLNEIQNSISSFEVYPNPASDFTSFKINSSKNTDAKLEVYNSLGSIVSTKNISLNEGKNKVDYNVENLSSGIYIASIKMGSTTTTKKFIVK